MFWSQIYILRFLAFRDNLLARSQLQSLLNPYFGLTYHQQVYTLAFCPERFMSLCQLIKTELQIERDLESGIIRGTPKHFKVG